MADMHTSYESTLEPKAIEAGYSFPILANLSIAISLKRIADKLEVASKQPILMSAEEYAKYEKLKS